MADALRRHPDEGRAPRRGLLRGPSPGLLLWTAFLEKRIEWLIEARRRWHEAAPPPRTRTASWRVALATAASVLGALAIIERLVGG